MRYLNHFTSVFLALLLISDIGLQANHLVGGEFSYECLGGNNYQINLTIYRDCNAANAADFDDPARIFFYDNDGDLIDMEGLEYIPANVVPIIPDLDDLCADAVPNICVEFFVYSEMVTLPFTPGGITMIYQRCCRNNGIVNIPLPGETGSTYELFIPQESPDCNNSSPVFNNLPPLIICEDFPLEFDFSASDLDGDELVYSICAPMDGANINDPEPGQDGQVLEPFPSDPLIWNTGFDENNQLGVNSTFEIDPATGLLTVLPENTGLYVIGVCVSEFRNGELLSTKVRDYQFNVIPCDALLVSVDAGDDIILCESGPVQIEGLAVGATNLEWTPAAAFDDNTLLNPTLTNAQAGTYTLSGSNNMGCNDSDEMEIVILDPIEIFIVEECNQDDFSSTFTISLDGGYPAFNGQATYSVTGVVNQEVGIGEAITINGEFSGTTITVNAVDDLGCSNSETIGPIECIKLAIELESFTATRNGLSAELAWTTRTEQDNDFFMLQSSRDGQVFEPIGIVAGAGNSLEALDYSFLDAKLGEEAAYYQLVAVDYNGRESKSDVLFLDALEVHTEGPQFVYPSIVQDLLYTNQADRRVKVSIYDQQGRQVLFQAQANWPIDLSGLSSAVYFVVLENGAERSVERIFRR